MSIHDAGLREQVERATELLYLRLNEILMERHAARQKEIDALEQQLETMRTERANILNQKDSERLDQIRERLMLADSSVSEALGLPHGWVDIREAIDATTETP